MQLRSPDLQASPDETSLAPQAIPPRSAPRRRSLHLLWGVPALLTAAAGAILLWTGTRSESITEGPATDGIAVSLGDIYSAVRINGTVAAERSAAIRAPRILGSRGDFNRGGGGAHDHGPGGHPDFTLTLLRLARGGTQVKTGDVVVEFDPENQVQRLDDYRDSVVQLKNSVRKMIANLAATKESHDQRIRVAWAEWQKALLDLKTVKIRTAIDAEKIRLSVEEAELTHQQLLAQRSRVEESQRASIRSSELLLAQAALELDRVERNVKRMSITSPIDGIVVSGNVVLNGELRQIREGDQVAAGQPVLYVVDPSSMVLNGTANQVDAERLRLGMTANIRLDAYPDLNLGGSLIGVGAMAKVSAFRAGYVGELPVRFRIEGRDSRLLPDLTGSADVLVDSQKAVVSVPRPTVFAGDGQHFVFVQSRDGWVRRPVVTGLQSATHVAIRAGLQPGEVIARRRPL